MFKCSGRPQVVGGVLLSAIFLTVVYLFFPNLSESKFGKNSKAGSLVSAIPLATADADANSNVADRSGVTTEINESEMQRPDPFTDDGESGDPFVFGVLSGSEDFEPVDVDPNQAPPTLKNIDEMPKNMYADQIRPDNDQPASFESDIYGFDQSLDPPNDDNSSNEPNGDFADQIDQRALNKQAQLLGVTKDRGLNILLEEVDSDSHPPTGTGEGVEATLSLGE